jgi:hypothetical protein
MGWPVRLTPVATWPFLEHVLASKEDLATRSKTCCPHISFWELFGSAGL